MDRIAQLKVFLESEPEDPFLHYAMAIEYVGRDEPQKAEQILTELQAKQPAYTALYYHLGKLQLKSGQREKAITTFEEGIRLTKISKNQHQLAELQTALNNLMYDDE